VTDVRTLPSYDDLRRENADLRRATFESRSTRAGGRLRSTPARVVRPSGRDWTKTAMVIGGSSAAGAGLGAIFGGKKGALIGAAIAVARERYSRSRDGSGSAAGSWALGAGSWELGWELGG